MSLELKYVQLEPTLNIRYVDTIRWTAPVAVIAIKRGNEALHRPKLLFYVINGRTFLNIDLTLVIYRSAINTSINTTKHLRSICYVTRGIELDGLIKHATK